MLDKLSGASIFSTIDVRSSYHQIQVMEGHEWSNSLCTLVIQEVHNASHFSVDKTVVSVRARFYWPSIDHDVAAFVKRCVVYQKRKGPTTNAGT